MYTYNIDERESFWTTNNNQPVGDIIIHATERYHRSLANEWSDDREDATVMTERQADCLIIPPDRATS